MLDVRPKLEVLTPDQIGKVHRDALQILSGTGIAVDDPGARARLEKAVGATSEDGRVRIPESLVQWAIDAAPDKIDIYDRLGAPASPWTAQARPAPCLGWG